MEPYQDYVELLQAFNAARVRYLLVGALAVSHYTQPRYTKDMDVWIEPTPRNAERVFRCLVKYGASMERATPKDFSVKGTVFQIGVEPVRIDVITDIAGLRFSPAWSKRKKIKFGPAWANIVGLDDLVRAKRASGRPQDKIDVEHLLLNKKRKR
jgi:hypothetical protein